MLHDLRFDRTSEVPGSADLLGNARQEVQKVVRESEDDDLGSLLTLRQKPDLFTHQRDSNGKTVRSLADVLKVPEFVQSDRLRSLGVNEVREEAPISDNSREVEQLVRAVTRNALSKLREALPGGSDAQARADVPKPNRRGMLGLSE